MLPACDSAFTQRASCSGLAPDRPGFQQKTLALAVRGSGTLGALPSADKCARRARVAPRTRLRIVLPALVRAASRALSSVIVMCARGAEDRANDDDTRRCGAVSVRLAAAHVGGSVSTRVGLALVDTGSKRTPRGKAPRISSTFDLPMSPRATPARSRLTKIGPVAIVPAWG